MPNENKQDFSSKIKLLKIYELLQKETDENHSITRRELCEKLNDMGISSNVRTLSKDIDVLNSYGYEIMVDYINHEKRYYVSDRSFTIPEIKIIIDAIQAANFITDKKTKELIEKVADLAGSHSGDVLKKNLVYFNTRKHTNEKIFYNIDAIEEAIVNGMMIFFDYFDFDENGNKVFRTKKDGSVKRYITDPIGLVFNEDNYYLIAYHGGHPNDVVTYRVDRMENVSVAKSAKSSASALKKKDNIAEYTKESFKMYDGKLTNVVLEFNKFAINAVFDKFGEKTKISKIDDNTYIAKVLIRESSVFFGWVFQFGKNMNIISPQNIIDEYNKLKDE